MNQSVHNLSAEEVRAYLDAHKPHEYTLLDVRQDWEYEEFHLPGAQLIPVAELADRMGEVAENKPVIAYCASGMRSLAAASLLNGQGYADVTNMVGGAMAWRGDAAYGPVDLGMIAFTGDETPLQVVYKAYAMEENLQKFYVRQAGKAETEEQADLFNELAGFEDVHKKTLYNLNTKITGEKADRAAFESAALREAGNLSEGGVDIDAFLDEYGEVLVGTDHIFHLAAMVETQALDYYLRCAMQAQEDETKDVFQLLAREEKAHLKVLGRFMDKWGSQYGH